MRCVAFALLALALALPVSAPAFDFGPTSIQSGNTLFIRFALDELPEDFSIFSVDLDPVTSFSPGQIIEIGLWDDTPALLVADPQPTAANNRITRFQDPNLGPPFTGAIPTDLSSFLATGRGVVSIRVVTGPTVAIDRVQFLAGRTTGSGSVATNVGAGLNVATNAIPSPAIPNDTDGDGVPDFPDNCNDTPNPGQEETGFPNGIGDACDCSCFGTLDLTAFPVTACLDLPSLPYTMVYTAAIPAYQDVWSNGCRSWFGGNATYRAQTPPQAAQCRSYIRDWLGAQQACVLD